VNNFKKGDMVYVPSQSRLYQLDEGGTPIKFVDLEKPRNLLVLGLNPRYYEVLHAGQHWHVKRNMVYQTGDENASPTY